MYSARGWNPGISKRLIFQEWVNPSSVFSPAEVHPGEGSQPGDGLRGEVLEPRQLLAVAWWEGEADAAGPGPDAGGDPVQETLLVVSGEDSSSAFGVLDADADNPAVVQVETSPTPMQSLAVAFRRRERGGPDRRRHGRLGSLAGQPVQRIGQPAGDSIRVRPDAAKTDARLVSTVGSRDVRIAARWKQDSEPGWPTPARRTGRPQFRDPHIRCSDHTSGRRHRTEGGRLLGAVAGGLE